MAAGSTYTPIATFTLGSASQSVTFSSIPSTYTDLRLIMWTTLGSELVQARFNSDTASNYSCTNLYGDGTTATSNRRSSQTTARLGVEGNNTTSTGIVTVDFLNYSNSTTYKTFLSRAAYPSQESNARVGLWRSTAAINTILISPFNVSWNFSAGNTFTLYGIAAA
jgi:hypothetical protein